MIQEAFRAYLEEAIGREKALVAFSAFEQHASVAVRMNPFKRCSEFDGEPKPCTKATLSIYISYFSLYNVLFICQICALS